MLAAQELQLIIEKISGAKLTVQRGALPANKSAILLGAKLACGSGLGAQLEKLDHDGLLCAAYQFLESPGCRWTMPGAFGEIYPSLTTI